MCSDGRKAKWHIKEQNQDTIKLECCVCGGTKVLPTPSVTSSQLTDAQGEQ